MVKYVISTVIPLPDQISSTDGLGYSICTTGSTFYHTSSRYVSACIRTVSDSSCRIRFVVTFYQSDGPRSP